MRPTSLLLAALALVVFAAGCHPKGGGGYLKPVPVRSVAR